MEVVGNEMALLDTDSVISFHDGPSKLEALILGLCLEGEGAVSINLQEYRLSPGVLVVALPNQIIEHR
ncbi:transcriptional regulator, AraC family, partial [gut metagenome]